MKSFTKFVVGIALGLVLFSLFMPLMTFLLDLLVVMVVGAMLYQKGYLRLKE